MDYATFTTIGSIFVFGVWLYIAYRSIKAYTKLIRQKGMSPFMTRQQLKSVTDPETARQIQEWKRLSKRLFLLWVATGFGYLLLAMIIGRTVGFKH